jgi:hypothetical protein
MEGRVEKSSGRMQGRLVRLKEASQGKTGVSWSSSCSSPSHGLLLLSVEAHTSRLFLHLVPDCYDLESCYCHSSFLFSPYTILTSLSRSTTTLDNLLVISSIHFAVMHKPMPALFLLALSTLTSLYPILLLPFLIAIFLETPTQSQRTPSISIIPPSPTESTSLNRPSFPPLTTASISSKPKAGPQIIKLLLNFTFSISILTLGFYLLNDRSWTGILKGPRVILGITDLTPNVGLSWYFFTEMFDHFRPFFTFVFQVRLYRFLFFFILSSLTI